MKPIYKPKTRAKEYCNLAINIYEGCNHGCWYCYAKKMFERWHPGYEFSDVKPREGIVEATKEQLSRGNFKGKTIQLCFTCDPYPAKIDTTPTREIIKAIKEAGANVQILTKGAERAERDLDLLDENDWFGVTYAGYSDSLYDVPKTEPGSDSILSRLAALDKAHDRGIKTWVLCEPVLNCEDIYKLIPVSYIDLFKIGKLNYYPSDINWGEFGHKCEALLKKYGHKYDIKEDLRAEMDKVRP